MAASITDIATRLELSAATVSRALRHDLRIHPQTRARVAAAAAELGYQGRARRNLAASRQRTRIGLLLRSQESYRGINATRILHGVTAEADAAGVAVNVLALRQRDGGDEPPVLPQAITAGECGAVVLEGRQPAAVVAAVAALVPVVTIDLLYDGLVHDAVMADNQARIAELTLRLAALGHRRLCFVPEWYPGTFNQERAAGFLRALVESGLPVGADSRLDPAAAYDAAGDLRGDALLAAHGRGVTAFVCVNDRVAGQALAILEQAGVAVPARASVTGFDAEAGPGGRLTSVDPRFEELGRAALDLALRRARAPAAAALRVSVAGQVMAGATIAPPPAAG